MGLRGRFLNHSFLRDAFLWTSFAAVCELSSLSVVFSFSRSRDESQLVGCFIVLWDFWGARLHE
ncbi:hypothetical protein RISK_002148 [Rhodopirellula islandica]|uniref:Uncharacterized protein n=1 Tax=Rhodopirellula islandica TaxID=595434 RepID=A0A0J1BG65_RHOIS|nr:hypothetical protein RISK_002148 [Rhodopirellula islandica]